jgi:hypothetical protein
MTKPSKVQEVQRGLLRKSLHSLHCPTTQERLDLDVFCYQLKVKDFPRLSID